MHNTRKYTRRGVWLAGTAAAVVLSASGALAQAGSNQLEQVTVTATRTTSTVNQVPLAVSAVTQADLDQQGVETFNDLLTAVPGLVQTSSLGTGLTNVSIRGLSQGGAGASTVGFYVDNVPIQTRDVGGNGGSSTNGTPLPPIFDLQRIEVLRGPQGTLYGASSEGGTIRYITPTPSLDNYSVYARAEVNSVEYGSMGYNMGLAVGGPIITDKVGYRVSAYWQHIGGYLDTVDPFSGKVAAKDINSTDVLELQGKLLVKPTNNFSLTFGGFYSRQSTPDAQSGYNLSTKSAIQVPTDCFRQVNTPNHEVLGSAPNKAVGGVPQITTSTDNATNLAACQAYIAANPTLPVYVSPDLVGNPNFPGGVNILSAAAAAENAAFAATGNPNSRATATLPGGPGGQYIYVRGPSTLGPYTLSPYQRIQSLWQGQQAASTEVDIASLNVEYDFPSFAVNWDNSYFRSLGISNARENSAGSAYYGNEYASYNGIEIFEAPYISQLNGLPQDTISDFISRNLNQQIVEELRFTSTDADSPWQWVAGIFFSANTHPANFYNTYAGGPNSTDTISTQPVGMDGIDQQALVGLGITGTQRWGSPVVPFGYNRVNFATELQSLRDTDAAIYGQVDYKPTPSWDFTVGLRQSMDHFSFWASHYGPVTGLTTGSLYNNSLNIGSTTSWPTNPKVGIKYNLDPTKFVYFSATRGFRPGGVNNHATNAICDGQAATATSPATGLAYYGVTADDLPTTYGPDYDWSYEVGSKLGLFNQSVQINADVYRIDWDSVQTTQTAGHSCGLVFTANAGTARSQGVEIDAQARLFDALTANASFEYDDAQYTSDAIAVHGRNGNPDLISAIKGQKFALPPWALSAGVRYDVVYGDYDPYVRVDYRVQGGYDLSAPGLGGYTPDGNHVPTQNLFNLRLGVDYGNYDFNAFATNLFDNKNGDFTGGRNGCQNAACSVYSSYTPIGSISGPVPRTLGIQMIYRQ